MVLLKGSIMTNMCRKKTEPEASHDTCKTVLHLPSENGQRHQPFLGKNREGLEIMESLRGRTSGLAIPTYIINGPNGLGKTPIMPNYLLYTGKDKAAFRNWQGKSFEVDNFSPDS